MAFERQIEANRNNAKKCTGPRTEAGKEKSSQNALKTGLDAKSEVLRFESRPDYEVLIAEFYTRYHPSVPEDRSLVDMLIRSEWLLRRYTSIDTAIWEREFFRTGDPTLGAAFLRNQDALDRVNSAQRNYHLALKQLLDIRSKRAPEEAPELQPEPEPNIEEPAPASPPEPAETESPNPKLVSFLPRVLQPDAQPESSQNPPSPPPNRRKIPLPPPKTMTECRKSPRTRHQDPQYRNQSGQTKLSMNPLALCTHLS